MKKYKVYRRIIVIIAVVIGLFFAINIGINFWLNKKLPSIIEEENNSPFLVKYESIDIDLFSRDIYIKNLKIFPKQILNDSIPDTGVHATIASVEISDFGIWDVLFHNKINAEKITVVRPEGIFYEGIEHTQNKDTKPARTLEQIITCKSFFLENGNFKIINHTTNSLVLSLANAHIELKNIIVTQHTLEQKLPVYFDDYAFLCDSLFYATKDKYHITIKRITAKKSNVNIDEFAMVNMLSRKQFVNSLAKEKDLFTLKVKNIKIENSNWGFINERFFFETSFIKLDEAAANIYRSKIPADDLSKKKLYSNMLRDLPINLKVDSLQMINSNLVYEEEKDIDFGAGKLSFHQFNMTVANITGGKDFASKEDVKIKIHNKFMNAANMEVNWNFNVLDRSDNFRISGKIINLNTTEIAPFTQPYAQLKFNGLLESVYFDFNGNDIDAKGNFIVNQKDLKLTIYQKKDPQKVNKIKTAIGNFLVKSNADKDKVKEVEIEVQRKQDRSVFNFLWLCLAEGLKKSLI